MRPCPSSRPAGPFRRRSVTKNRAREAFAGLKAPSIWDSVCDLLKPRELECLQVEVTSCCPGRCTYCPHTTRADVWRSRHMQPETFAALYPIMKKTTRVHL